MAESRSSSNAFSKHGNLDWGTKKNDPGFQHFPTQVLATATVYTVSCAVFPPARIHGNTPSLDDRSVNFPTSDAASVFEFLSRKLPIDICPEPRRFPTKFHVLTYTYASRAESSLRYYNDIWIHYTIYTIFLLLLLLLLLRLDSPSNSYFVYVYFIFLFGQSARVYARLECRIWNRIDTVHPCKVANCRKDRAGCFKSKLHWGGSSLLVPKSACVSPSHAN